MGRLTYYQFPDDTPESILLQHGCGVVICSKEDCHKIGNEDAMEDVDTWTIYPDEISDERRPQVVYINHTINCSVSTAKKLIKQFGGSGWTYHMERDGTVFDATNIELKGNNSKFKYSRHL